MTTIVRKPIITRFYACGGFGIKNVNRFQNTEIVGDLGHLRFSYLDTSGSDLPEGINPEEVYMFRGMDGGGKDPKTTYPQVLPFMGEVLEKHKAEDFNVVVHSSSGGSGASVGPALVSKLLELGKNVIVVQVGSTGSKKEVMNTINSIRTYSNFSNKYERPVVSYYRENNDSTSRRQVDEHVHSALFLISLLFSAENKGLDTADLSNLLGYHKVTSFQPELSSIDFHCKTIKLPNDLVPQAMAILFGKTDPDASKEGKQVQVEYTAEGFFPDQRADFLGEKAPVYGVVYTGDFLARLKELQVRLDSFVSAEKTRGNLKISVGVTDADEDGMVF